MIVSALTVPSDRMQFTERFFIESETPSHLSPCSVGFIALLGGAWCHDRLVSVVAEWLLD
jgi:hypothetical protein